MNPDLPLSSSPPACPAPSDATATALHESEQRYRSLIEWSPDAISVHRDGKLIYVNPAAIQLLGARSAQDLIGKSLLDLLHPDFHQIVLARARQVSSQVVDSPMLEEKFLKLDGTAVDVEVRSTAIVYDGAPAIHTVARDITERKQAEAVLRALNAQVGEQSRLLQTTLDSINQGIFMIDANDRVTTFNPRVCELLNLSASLLASRPTLLDLTEHQRLRGDFGEDGCLVDVSARSYVMTQNKDAPPPTTCVQQRTGAPWRSRPSACRAAAPRSTSSAAAAPSSYH